jgi:hypothetical protein
MWMGGRRVRQARRPFPSARRKTARTAVRGGAPKVEFDLDDLRDLARIGCTNETMSSLLKVGKRTLQRRIADTPAVAEAIQEGRATMERSLRTAQLRNALSGNPTMQIWLGKQLLGQRDVRAVELTGGDGGPLEVSAELRPVLEEKIAEFIKSRRS